MENTLIKDAILTAGVNLEKLIKEEAEAVLSYEHEIENCQNTELEKVLRHIQAEEQEHIKELNAFLPKKENTQPQQEVKKEEVKTEVKEEVKEDSAVKDDVSDYEKYKNMIASGTKLTMREGFDKAEELHEAGKNGIVICKIPNEKYAKWYEEHKEHLDGCTLDDETTYVTGVHEKAFDPGMGGYSIFAQSLGSIKRDERYFGTDRIERFPFEWMMVFEKE